MSEIKGVTRTGSVLDRIVADLHAALEDAKNVEPESALRSRLHDFSNGNGLRTRAGDLSSYETENGGIHLIAEIKKASPSRGTFVEELDHRRIAREYAEAGATGISVVTEPNYFRGDLHWLLDIRRLLSEQHPGRRPTLLRKDFLTDPYEVLQSRVYGADNILLIVALLDDALLRDLLDEARGLDLDALVEVHTEEEAERAVRAGANLFGINNRDLHTFNVDLATTTRIRPLLPPDAVVVAESGIHSRADVQNLARVGVNAILVGEAFMTAPDIRGKMAELLL